MVDCLLLWKWWLVASLTRWDTVNDALSADSSIFLLLCDIPLAAVCRAVGRIICKGIPKVVQFLFPTYLARVSCRQYQR